VGFDGGGDGGLAVAVPRFCLLLVLPLLPLLLLVLLLLRLMKIRGRGTGGVLIDEVATRAHKSDVGTTGVTVGDILIFRV
jgi:hypothetical protein